jgi:hypothetical protein
MLFFYTSPLWPAAIVKYRSAEKSGFNEKEDFKNRGRGDSVKF